MTHVISTINLKGGVGKTTTTVALAETLSVENGKRVLVIDLDPQTNATTMLIGEDRWDDLNNKKHTLASLFDDALDPTPTTGTLISTRPCKREFPMLRIRTSTYSRQAWI